LSGHYFVTERDDECEADGSIIDAEDSVVDASADDNGLGNLPLVRSDGDRVANASTGVLLSASRCGLLPVRSLAQNRQRTRRLIFLSVRFVSATRNDLDSSIAVDNALNHLGMRPPAPSPTPSSSRRRPKRGERNIVRDHT